ncbi:MAG: CDP-alcohol phosphatidyltransferase family protein [Planctomycetota bacterium]
MTFAISKAVDALARSADQALFERHLETACWLIVAAGIFDVVDGKVARMTKTFSDLGAQLDSLADAITFGVAPAIVAKVLLEHEGLAHTRVHFIAAAAYALMAILRLARFNAQGNDDHDGFTGLPTPAAAGMLVSTVLMFLSLGGTIEAPGGEPTPLGRGLEVVPLAWRDALTRFLLLPTILVMLPALALLMVSRVRYIHMGSLLGGAQSRSALVPLVFGALGLYLAPVLFMFLSGLIYVGWGLWVSWVRPSKEGAGEGDREAA